MPERVKFSPRVSIRTRMLLLMLSLSALSVLAIALIAVDSVQREGRDAQALSSSALRNQAQDYLVQLTLRSARESDLALDHVLRIAKQVASYTASIYDNSASLDSHAFWPVETHMAFGDQGQYANSADDPSSVYVPNTVDLSPAALLDVELTAYLDLILPAAFESDPNTVAIYFATPREVVRYYPNIDLGAVLPPDFRATQRPWYITSILQNNPDRLPRWSPVYEDATGRGLVTTATSPVYNRRQQLVGVVGIDVTLGNLADSIESSRVLPAGYSFLIDDTGHAIALPEQGYRDILGRGPEPDEFGTDLTSGTTPLQPIIARMIAGEDGLETLESTGRQLFVAFAPLESTGWSLGSVIEAEQVLSALSALQTEMETGTRSLVLGRILPVTAGIVAIVLIVGLLLTNRLVRPIRQLAAAAKRIGAGQWETEVEHRSLDELGYLAQAFNTMTAQIRTMISGLEEQVAERTRGIERRALLLQTTAEIAKSAAEMQDPQALMAQIIELIRQRFGFYHASIFTLDESGTWAELTASTGEAGRKLLARRHRLAVGSASIIGWVAANRLPRVALDVATDPFHFRNPLLPETRAEMAVPLIIGQRLVGALDVQSTQPQAFGEDDVRAIEAIAGELAIAIDNARLLADAQQQLTRVESLYRGQVRESWSRLAKSGSPTVFRLSPSGARTDSDGEFPTVKRAQELRETVFSPDGREVAVPVQLRGEVIAAISARKPDEGEPWSEEEIALMQAVAGQAALALESSRQYAEEQRRVRELEVVNRVSQAVSQLLRLDSLFRVVHAQINGVLGDTDLFIALYDPLTDQISFPYASEQQEVLRIDPIPLGQGLTSLVIRSRQPLLLVEDTERVAVGLGAVLVGQAAKSWLGVPMMVGEDIIGVMGVQDVEHEHRFSEEDAALLATIASQVATALQNARLLEQVQRTARRERLIHEVTSKVRRSSDIRGIIETTARELGRALNASRAAVRLGTGSPSGQSDMGDGQEGPGGAAQDQTSEGQSP